MNIKIGSLSRINEVGYYLFNFPPFNKLYYIQNIGENSITMGQKIKIYDKFYDSYSGLQNKALSF